MRVIVLLCYFCMFGCNQISHTSSETLFRMKMTAPQKSVLFIVDTNGRIAFGGGFDAVEGNTTWQGQLNDAQRMQLDELIDAAKWGEITNASSIRDATPHYAIQLHREATLRFDLPITDAMGTAVYDLLDAAALSRLAPYLDTLPKPSIDTIIDREVGDSLK